MAMHYNHRGGFLMIFSRSNHVRRKVARLDVDPYVFPAWRAATIPKAKGFCAPISVQQSFAWFIYDTKMGKH